MDKVPNALSDADRPFPRGLPTIAAVPGLLAGLPGTLIQPQENSLWCWVAVAQFVHAVFGKTVTQTSIVEGFYRGCKGADGSAPDPSTDGGDAYNKFEDLEKVLGCFGLLKEAKEPGWDGDAGLLGALSERVLGEVRDNRPVCVRVGKDLYVGHFVVISGWIGSGEQGWFEVMDPAAGEIRYMTAQQALLEYACWGASTDLYFTRGNRDHS